MAEALRISVRHLATLWADLTLTKEDIAARLGCSTVSVWRSAKALGLPKRGRGGANRIDDAQVRAMWAEGQTALQIARALGRTRATIESVVRRLDLPRHGRGLSPALVADDQFVRMWRAGVRLSDMAAHHGVSIMSVRTAARHAGLPARGCAKGHCITIDQFRADALRAAMASAARAEQAALRRADMVDRVQSDKALAAIVAERRAREARRAVAA